MDIEILEVLTLLTIVVLAATLMATIAQNKIIRSGSSSQNLLSIINFLQDEETRTSRRVAITRLRNKHYKKWTKAEKEHADKVCSSYSIAGRLIKNRYVEAELFLDDWGPSIKHCYEALVDHLRSRREESGERYWDDFDWLYGQVISWEKEHLPNP